jgi:hypothetical protein
MSIEQKLYCMSGQGTLYLVAILLNSIQILGIA